MTTPNEPGSNLLMVIGQLMEATKASAESIRLMSQDARASVTTLVSTTKTVENLLQSVARLESAVYDPTNPDNLALCGENNAAAVEELNRVVTTLGQKVENLHKAVEALRDADVRTVDMRAFLWRLCEVAAWVVATGIAVYAALHGR